MIESGMRLQLTVNENSFTLMDTLTDKMIIYRDGVYIADTLDHLETVEALNGIISQLMLARIKNKKFGSKPDTCAGFELIQRKHLVMDLRTSDSYAEYNTGLLTQYPKFDKAWAISQISKVNELLCKAGNKILNTKVAAVRRHVDSNLLVIRGLGHEIVVREENVSGNALANVLCDRGILPFIYVDIHLDEELVYFFNGSLNLVFTIPYDESFSVYFESDTNAFKSEG